jgi:hypothetical protein
VVNLDKTLKEKGISQAELARLEVPQDVITKALGQADSSVTSIYIKFDYSRVDDANRKVLDYIFKQKTLLDKEGFYL